MNACYSRACWEEIRFPDVAYAEDQAFGRAMLEAGWVKVFHPAAAVRHAHDYGPVEFMRRYFDEYRGLRETSGHVEPLRAAARRAREVRRATRAGCASSGWPARRRGALAGALRWCTTRRAGSASALGSRAERLPAPRPARDSRWRAAARSRPRRPRPTRAARPQRGPPAPAPPYEEMLRLSREGAAPLDDRRAGHGRAPRCTSRS